MARPALAQRTNLATEFSVAQGAVRMLLCDLSKWKRGCAHKGRSIFIASPFKPFDFLNLTARRGIRQIPMTRCPSGFFNRRASRDDMQCPDLFTNADVIDIQQSWYFGGKSVICESITLNTNVIPQSNITSPTSSVSP